MTTWVLLRGLTREAGHWGDFPARLAAQLGGEARVLALDLPGNGTLHAQPSPCSVARMSAFARAELERLGAKPPYVLVAMSLGAMVALQWASETPHELSACALINTSVRGHGAFWQRLRPRNYLRLLGLPWPWRSALSREASILAMTSNAPARHADVPARWTAIALARTVSPLNALRQLVAAARFTPPRVRPPLKMIVLSSARDGLVSPACSRRLAEAWRMPLRLHPDAGHDLPLDDPGWVLAQLRELLHDD